MKKDLLLRQVHPAHLVNGLSSGAFRPTPNDEDKLSVDCSNITDARSSFELHRQKTKIDSFGARVPLETAGTWAFPRETCDEEKLKVSADPLKDLPFQPDNPAHHLVDFSEITATGRNKNNNVAKRLKQKAQEIGKLWPKD